MHHPLKRAGDVLASAAALLVLLPLLLLIAIVIRLDSPGPALFRQRRTGLDGRTFEILKFRTMRVAEPGDAAVQARRDDDRVTAIGRLLRRTSLDELPQLANVLRGDMSVIGPRPHATGHDQAFASVLPDYFRRFAARPGLTGLAQVRGLRGEVHALSCAAARLEADLEYVETWTLRGDMVILLRTLPLLFKDSAAY